MSSQRCLVCRRQISFRERSRGVMAMSLVGFPRFHASKLMPRCTGCLSCHVDKYRLTPGACIRALGRPVAAIHVPVEDWDAIHREIVAAGADFCAARMPSQEGREFLAVVTTAVFPGWKTTEADLAAGWLEGYIRGRPPGAVPRFVASPTWDPFNRVEPTHEDPSPADTGSVDERLSDHPPYGLNRGACFDQEANLIEQEKTGD